MTNDADERIKAFGHFEKLLFCPISALCLKIYPRNINYMPVVNFVACLDLDQISADFEISNFSRYPFIEKRQPEWTGT